MKKITLLTLTIMTYAMMGLSGARAQEIYVVVNVANPVNAMTTKETISLYMGRSRSFPNSSNVAIPFDLPKTSTLRDVFYKKLTGMEARQINSYWARLLFTGEKLPPQQLPNEAQVAEMIKRNPSAIGYMSTAPTDKSLKTILVLK